MTRPGRPTDNAEVERCHRTVHDYAIVGHEQASVLQLQRILDQAVCELNFELPSRAEGCHRQPSVTAHPELLQPRRPFRPEHELGIFDLKRVDAHLAAFTWQRTVGKTGQIEVGRHRYSVGRAYARGTVLIRFDPADRHFVFSHVDDPEVEIRRRPAKGLDVADLTGLAEWPIGGFAWLAATISYARRSGDACLYCGRRDGAEGWVSPKNAARWGRIAAYVAMAVPIFYALTGYAWALGIPLGISEEFLRRGQELGMWTAGLSMANFGLVGAVLTLGLVQHWGEVFLHWMIGLAGRRVPIALAVVPASIVSVLLVVGGIEMWSGYAQRVVGAVSGATRDMGIVGYAPTGLFPVWGVALAVATLGYYYRRRGPCEMCGLGPSETSLTG